jgi:hypothetical protein
MPRKAKSNAFYFGPNSEKETRLKLEMEGKMKFVSKRNSADLAVI